jgi:hypothetical protein
MDRPITNDGYSWFWALYFHWIFGEIAILFPWSQDWDKADGSQSDRSIAVHTKGLVPQWAVDRVIHKLTKAILELHRESTYSRFAN